MGQFRRGVCAFNLEALGVLKPTDEADEVMKSMSAAMQGIPAVHPAKQPLMPQNMAAVNTQPPQQQPQIQAHKSVMRQGLSQGRASRGTSITAERS